MEKGGDTLNLSYFDLLSPAPVQLSGIGGIVSPKLREISAIGYNTYQFYLSVLQMDGKSVLSAIGLQAMPNAEQIQTNLFELLTADSRTADMLREILNFFLKEDVSYSENHKAFLVRTGNDVTGMITSENYPQVCEAVCLRNGIRQKQEADISKAKNKKALEIMNKLQMGRAKKAKQVKSDDNLELGNILSAVANKSQSLNIVNIWDLTVYQLWDCFFRLSNNNIYNIQSMSVATWGDKDNHFDATAWFKRMDTGN